MNKLFTYIPLFLFIMIMLFIDHSFVKWFLLPIIVCLMVFSKYKRSKIGDEEVEYDDRVNTNILKWSLHSMFVLNTVLILILFIDSQKIIKLDISVDMVVMFLLITLFIPFYIVPAIIKRY